MSYDCPTGFEWSDFAEKCAKSCLSTQYRSPENGRCKKLEAQKGKPLTAAAAKAAKAATTAAAAKLAKAKVAKAAKAANETPKVAKVNNEILECRERLAELTSDIKHLNLQLKQCSNVSELSVVELRRLANKRTAFDKDEHITAVKAKIAWDKAAVLQAAQDRKDAKARAARKVIDDRLALIQRNQNIRDEKAQAAIDLKIQRAEEAKGRGWVDWARGKKMNKSSPASDRSGSGASDFPDFR